MTFSDLPSNLILTKTEENPKGNNNNQEQLHSDTGSS